MAINVKDKNGKHLGYIHSYNRDFNCFLVAISNHVLDESYINYEQMDKIIAKENGLLTWNGKIKEQQYQDFLRETKIQYEDAGIEAVLRQYDVEASFFKRLLFLIALKSNYSNPKINDVYSYDLDSIEGYILYNLGELKYEGDCLVVEDEINYIEKAELEKPPIFGEIFGIPIVRQDTLFLKESDHTHYTMLKVKSGNIVKNIDIRTYVNCKKGMLVQFYDATNTQLYCDGVIYIVE